MKLDAENTNFFTQKKGLVQKLPLKINFKKIKNWRVMLKFNTKISKTGMSYAEIGDIEVKYHALQVLIFYSNFWYKTEVSFF